MQVHSLAYQYAKALNRKCLVLWETNKMAGKDWFIGFMEHLPQLSLRSPDSSLGQVTSFNKSNLDAFLSNLKSIYDCYKSLLTASTTAMRLDLLPHTIHQRLLQHTKKNKLGK